VVVLLFTTVACLGGKDSVRAAAMMIVIELAGLMLVVSAGLAPIRDLRGRALALVPADFDAWISVCVGACLAFFAFTGFDNLANMAEEAKNVGRTIPRAILLSLFSFCGGSLPPPGHVGRPGTRPRWLSSSGLGSQEALRRPASSARRHA